MKLNKGDLAVDVRHLRRLSMQEILRYEIHSHWLARWIGFEWGQDLMGKYFAWKVRRKYNRYLVSLEERKRVIESNTAPA